MKKKKVVFILLIVVLLGIFGYSAYMVGSYFLEVSRSEKVVAQAAQYVHVRQGTASGQTGTSSQSGNSHTGHKADLPSLDQEQEQAEGIEVDFDELWKINGDIIAWIYCPDSPINYPIVQSDDNEYYLRRLLNGRWNICGTLFLDFRCPDDFSGPNNIVYGHNMKNGSMFGSLARYAKQSYYDSHPVMYLATPEQLYRVELFAGFTTDALDNLYDANATADQLQALRSRSNFKPDHEIMLDGPVLTMSTCSYAFENARYVVMGKLVPID